MEHLSAESHHTFAKARVVDAARAIISLDDKNGNRSFVFERSLEPSEIPGLGQYRCLGKNESHEQCERKAYLLNLTFVHADPSNGHTCTDKLSIARASQLGQPTMRTDVAHSGATASNVSDLSFRRKRTARESSDVENDGIGSGDEPNTDASQPVEDRHHSPARPSLTEQQTWARSIVQSYGNATYLGNGDIQHDSSANQRRIIFKKDNSRRSSTRKTYHYCKECLELLKIFPREHLCEFGWSKVSKFSAIVQNGVFVVRNPDDCGVDITTIDGTVSESFHLCCSEELKSKINQLSQHTLVQTPKKRPRRSSNTVPQQPTASTLTSAKVPVTQRELADNYGNVIRKPNGHVSYRSRLYKNHQIDFSRPSAPGPKQWFRCTACDEIRTTSSTKIPGCVGAKLFSAIVRGGQFVERDPDVCGLKLLFANGTSRCVHVCLDAELQRLIGGPAQPPRKQMRLSSFFDKPSKMPGGPSHAENAQAIPMVETTQADNGSVTASQPVDVVKPKPRNEDAMNENVSSTPMSISDDIQFTGAAAGSADSDDDIKVVYVEQKRLETNAKESEGSPGKKTLTFDDFIVVKGLEKDFVRFRLRNQDRYPRIDELREAFLEERGLLMQFVSF